MPTRPLALGRTRPLGAAATTPAEPLALPAHHLVTHGVIVGMTGSGKTGLAMVLVEEALRSDVPVLLVDVKGDLANLLLTFPTLSAAEFAPWVDATAAAREGRTPEQVAEQHATRWREGLATAGLSAADVAALRAKLAPRLITPGTTAGEPLHVLSALEQPTPLWDQDEEAAREALSAALSLLLRLLDRDGDAARSREHVVLAHLAERRLRAGKPAGLAELLGDLSSPPLATVGALPLDEFLPPKERQALAQDLNTLLASPTFAAWRKGARLDVGEWLTPREGKTPAVIVSVAHLDDQERMLVLGLLLEQLLAWVRTLPGTSDLRALVLFDEVFGFLPPHPAAPPTKRPLLALLKQARAFGVGVVLATQNPMDLDYKALSNAGTWFVGRLQTDADRERVVEGLAGSDAGAGAAPAELAATLKALPPRTFLLRDVHRTPSSALLETRWTLSWLRGPLTRAELRRLVPAPANVNPPTPANAPLPAPAAAAPTSATATAPTPASAAPLAPASASAPASATPPPALAPSTLSSPSTAASTAPAPAVPPSPAGWRTHHGPPPHPPRAGWQYTPWVAASVTALARDARLGVSRPLATTFAAPLLADGKPDLTRAVAVDPARLAHAPVASAPHAPLPAALAKKTAQQSAARAVREHAYRALEARVLVHREFKLASAEGEAPQAFAARCVAEARRRLEGERATLLHRHAPRLARVAEHVAAAQTELDKARKAAQQGAGPLEAVVLGLVVGSRQARRAESVRAKGLTRLERAQRDHDEALAAQRAAVAERDAELAALVASAERAHEAIEPRALVPRKSDVAVEWMAIAWAAE